MKMKKHLILSMLLLGFAGMLEAENVQRTLPRMSLRESVTR